MNSELTKSLEVHRTVSILLVKKTLLRITKCQSGHSNNNTHLLSTTHCLFLQDSWTMQPDNAKPKSDLHSSILASQLQEKGKLGLGLGPCVGNVPTASVQKSFMLCFLGLDNSPIKISIVRGWESFQVDEHTNTGSVSQPNSRGTKACTQGHPRHFPVSH